MSGQGNIATIAFDGDDTLWHSQAQTEGAVGVLIGRGVRAAEVVAA